MVQKDSLTTAQVIVIVASTIIGVGTLILPRVIADKVQTPDVWISLIMGGGLVVVAGLIMGKLNKRFPNKTFYQYNTEIIGKWLGYLLTICFTLYCASIAAFEIRTMTEVVSSYLLPNTPRVCIVVPMMWIGTYLIFGGINAIARFLEFFFVITIGLFLLSLFLGFKIFELNNIRPILGLGIMPVLKGIQPTFYAFTGVEYILVITAFMKNKQYVNKAIFIGILIPLLLYLVTLILVIGSLSIDETRMQTWPTISLIRQYEMTGIFFERLEPILLSVWVIQIFTTFVTSHYIAALGLSQISRKNINFYIYMLLPIIYIISILPKNINEVFKFGDALGYCMLIFAVCIPAVLLLFSVLRRKKDEVL
ncbi:GerAB/ArcD/ProY family transporter [Bacillus thuringiensis]|uniref:GerAB/ArcD/ProY family transporter n=1 Tax=Bacillus thuringiensis TaxID=1428 RepID=UPI001EDF69A7|nr:GerAB/ArcD/ProY family transporter [Bacillus thuringiensis]MCG3424354.1 spore germination protein [Bacillus thuringiensis]